MTNHLGDDVQPEVRVSVFDGHNDVLTQLRDSGGIAAAASFLQKTEFHIDAVKSAKGGLAGGFFAMWVDSPSEQSYQALMQQSEYDVPLPASVPQFSALSVVF